MEFARRRMCLDSRLIVLIVLIAQIAQIAQIAH